jgi:NADH dehydrogenase FAD-containing subunit
MRTFTHVCNYRYTFGCVENINPETKTITLAGGESVSYKVVIIATGSKTPLVAPKLGDTLGARIKEVRAASQAIAQAGTVVFNGAGVIGIELAGDVRARHPNKTIKLLSRDGGVLSKTHPDAMQKRVKAVLDRMNIDVVKGTVPQEFGTGPVLSPGEITLTNTVEGTTEPLKFDFYMPSFAQGPNTQFLGEAAGVLNERGFIIANASLQSTVHPEIFGVNITTIPLTGHPVSSRVTAQAKTCAKNAKRFLDGKSVLPHVDKEGPPPLARPMNIKIGHGKGGYMIFDDLGPPGVCCCLPCGGGFPFCPPPCCWWCAPGCARCLGTCGGPSESEDAAVFMKGFMLPQFTAPHLYNGMGKLPPDAEAIDRD